MATKALPDVTEEEYLAQESRNWRVGDYFQGRIYPLENASAPHGQIVANLIYALTPSVRKRGCTIYGSMALVRVNETGLYTHPDVTIVCGNVQYADARRQDMILNPALIIEVASPRKFKHYRKIPSLQEYLTVEQAAPELSRYLRQSNSSWLEEDFEGLENTLHLKTLDFEIPFSAIYEGVQFS
jgi:Uma2 family endonuclease